MATLRHKMAIKPKRSSYKHAFVETMPDVLEEGVLYVCVGYATSAHNCFCGCGREVVTPIHPTKWKLAFDGVTVSLAPSVGSWSLPCKSHYWLENGRVYWADTFSDEEIRAVRLRDLRAQESYFESTDGRPPSIDVDPPRRPSIWRSLANWFQGK